MYLKDICLNGFKSFADTTRIALDDGVTAIVGPNGCGKSNIAEAIRWVLGEQRAKSLRAGSMQDVIFQGTDARKPVNLSEVSLIFTDCEAELGTAFNEVEIKRRVTRDGGSDYYLNGKNCRLKDIQRLFLDTGIGQVSYSFMLQGQIDQILSTNPSERRTIFEEAAGISKYKAQRREALNKLALVDTNLARVTDVMEEISRQIGSLKRQASKALRYKRFKRRLTHLDLASGARKYSGLNESITGLETEAAGLRKKAQALGANMEAREKELAEKKNRRSALYDDLQETQQSVFNLSSEREQAQNQSEFALLRAKDLQGRIAELEKELASISERKNNLAQRAAGDNRQREDQASVLGSSGDVFKERNNELMQSQEKLSRAEAELQQCKQDLLMAESSLTRLRSNCTTLEVDLKTYQVRHANLSEEVYRLKEESLLLEKESMEIQAVLKKRNKDREKETSQLEKLRDNAAAAQEKFRDLQREFQEADRGLAGISARIHILNDLQEKLEGFSEGAKAILQGKLDGLLPEDAFHLLSKNLNVESDYTEALVALLGPAVDTIVIGDWGKVVPVTEALESRKLGRACLQIATAAPTERKGKGKLPSWLVPAGSVVKTKNNSDGPLADSLFKDCYFCGNLCDFLDFWSKNPNFPFLLTATKSGQLVDRRGLVYGGHKQGESATYLQRKAELAKLKKEENKEEKKLEGLRLKSAKALEKLEKDEQAVEVQRSRLMETIQEISAAQAQEKNTLENIEENKRKSQFSEKELVALEHHRDDSQSRLEKAQKELAAGDARIDGLREKITEWESDVEKFREKRDQRRERLAEARLEVAELRQRLALIDRDLGDIESQSGELSQLKISREQEIDTLGEQIGALEKTAEDEAAKVREIEKTLAAAKESLEKNRIIYFAAENEIKTGEEAIALQRDEHRAAEGALNRHEVRLARENSEISFLLEEARREYQVELPNVDWENELWQAGELARQRVRLDLDEADSLEKVEEEKQLGEPTAEDLQALHDTDWNEITEEAEALRGRLASMGPVNLIAIEEYRELKERHEFLKEQSDDLWKSKEQLLEAIDKINQTSQSLFEDTFAQVRKNFTYTFDALFGGGYADLQLIDKEDVLESGIDIIARPPGTRLKTLFLLSGGQKTMTAVALLFAIYMVKPSPFCMLDELDAPLDDANIGRFVAMLQNFTKYSQFIIITHNKRTIASADSIYGVTMQEKGISKLVSMRFNKETGSEEEVA